MAKDRWRGAALWVLLGIAAAAGHGALAQTADSASRTNELSFLAADTNGDGLVDEAELGADQAKRFADLDADGDGFITAAELDAPDRAQFSAIDQNGDGKLSFVEVMAAKMDDFGAADGNGDHRVSYEEVVAFEGKQ